MASCYKSSTFIILSVLEWLFALGYNAWRWYPITSCECGQSHQNSTAELGYEWVHIRVEELIHDPLQYPSLFILSYK